MSERNLKSVFHSDRRCTSGDRSTDGETRTRLLSSTYRQICVFYVRCRGARGSVQLAGVSRRKSEMFVVLDRSDGVYTAGETVRGHVNIVLTQEVPVIGQ